MRRILIFLLILLSVKTFGSHIVGGEFELLHLNEYRYRLNLIIYFDLNFGNPGARDDFATVRIFRKADNAPMMDVTLPYTFATEVSYFQPECSKGEIRTQKLLYTTNIDLPPEIYNDPEGYYIAWERCCRNYTITNIYSADPQSGSISAGQTFYLEFPPVVKNGNQFINSSPQLFPPLNDYACPNRPYWVDFAGVDVDGDSLVYSLVTPRNTFDVVAIPEGGPQPGPYPPVVYQPGFSSRNIMNGAPDLAISRTGFLTVTPTTSGLFVFAVKCEEYRDGKKIGELIRDFQMLVLGSCPVADKPLVEGRSQADPNVLVKDYMNVTFPSNIADEDRCVTIQVSDLDSEKEDDGFAENIWLSVIPIGFDPGEQDVKGVLPDVSAVTLNNGSIESFDICFPECPYVNGPYTLGVIAFDDACALPLTDTLRINVNVEPPPNQRARFVTDDVTTSIVEGNNFELDIQGLDPDGDSLIVDILTGGFNLADVGMSFEQSQNINGQYTTFFKWETGCDVYDFTQQTEFLIKILIDDVDFCGFREPDTLTLDLAVILPLNTDPVISTDLPQSSFIHRLNEPLNFNVFGLDTDGDELVLRVEEDGFALADYEISFPTVNGFSQVAAEFNWLPSCENVTFDPESNNRELRFWFILNDLDKCKFPNFDSLEVNVTLIRPNNTPPQITINNRNDRVSLQDDTVKLKVGDFIDFEVIANDLERNNINLILADSSRVPTNLQFEPATGTGTVKSEVKWQIDCANLNEGFSPSIYTLYLGSADDQCFSELSNARRLILHVSDVESVDTDFLPANVFTPNGDGVNDTYSLANLPVDNCTGAFRSFRVYNRWGTEVYVSIERDFVWTGEDLVAGVYFYTVEFTNKDYSGTISILK